MKTRCLFFVLIACNIGIIQAHQYESEYKSNMIYYNIISENPAAMQVTYKGTNSSDLDYVGNVEIPGTIQCNGKTYTVTAIGEKAFYSCSRLISLTLPNTITKIDKNAFYDNKILNRIKINSHLDNSAKETFYGSSIYKRVKNIIQEQNNPIGSTKSYGQVTKYNLLFDVAWAEKDGKWGIIDRIGNVVIPFEYDDYGDIYATKDQKTQLYRFVISVNKNGKWGLIDMNNRKLVLFMIKDKYDVSKHVNLELTKTKTEFKRGHYDKIIAQINSAYTECILRVNEEILTKEALPKEVNGLWGFISKDTGSWIVYPTYNSCVTFKEKNRFLVSQNGLYGLLEEDGKTWVLDGCTYEMSPLQDCYLFYKNGKYGLVSPSGWAYRCIFDNIIYAGHFNSTSLFYMVYNSKWGLASTNHILCDQVYDAIGEFQNGVAPTYFKKYVGSIDTLGKEVVSIVKGIFFKAYNMSDNAFQEKVDLYNEAITIDKELNSGWAASCYNNIGVMYQGIGDKDTALAFYDEALKISPKDELYVKNRKRVKDQISLDRFVAITNALSGTLNAISGAKINNQNYNGSNINNMNPSSKSSASYQTQYNLWARNAESNYNTLMNKSQYKTDSNNELLINQAKRFLRESQNNMSRIRSEAARYGITIAGSHYETIGY